MSSVIKCRACGAKTPLGRKFCMKCGQELDIKNLRPGGGSDVGQQILRALRLVISLALLLSLVQMLRAVPQQGRIGTDDDAQRFLMRLKHLDSGVMKGQAVEEVLPETELNAYLQRLVVGSPSRSKGGAVGADIAEIGVKMLPESLVVVWRAKIGALPLSLEATCLPTVGAAGLEWQLFRVRMGHLPLPRVVAEWTLERWVRMFDNLTHERELLASLTSLQIAEGRALAKVGGSR